MLLQDVPDENDPRLAHLPMELRKVRALNFCAPNHSKCLKMKFACICFLSRSLQNDVYELLLHAVSTALTMLGVELNSCS